MMTDKTDLKCIQTDSEFIYITLAKHLKL